MSNSLFSQLLSDPLVDASLSTNLQQLSLVGRCMIENLPYEVLHNVLSELPVTDLKAFRLTSKKLTRAPVEHIFRHVRITIHPRSIFSIGKIAADEEVRKSVRMLTFDLRMLWREVIPRETWRDVCVQVGKRSCPDLGKIRIANYDSYVEYVKGQNEVARSGIGRVCSFFNDLTNIQHLELTGGTDHGAMIPTTQDYIDFKTTWPKLGVAPHRKGNTNAEVHVDRVLTAALSSKNSLTSVSLVGVELDFVCCTTPDRQAQWHHGLRHVRHLKLHLCMPNPKPGIFDIDNDAAFLVHDYAQFLTSPARLETLDFALCVEPPQTRNEMPWTSYRWEKDLFDAIRERPSFMQHIKKLSLAEFVFSPNDFIALLSHNTARTLKSLTFHKIHLSEGSWLVFLRQLAVAAELDHFSLSGWISSQHEGWNVLTQEEAATYYGRKDERLHPWDRDNWDYNPDCLVTCEAFKDWNDKIEALEEKWCIRSQIEDWIVSAGGTRRDLSNKGDDPTKWAGWSCDHSDSLTPSHHPSKSWHDDGFPLMQGYLPPCAVHHAPSIERQKQYRYESRWRTRLNRDFSFVWAEELMRSVREGGRSWQPCPEAGNETVWNARTRFCPDVLAEDEFVVDEEMVYEDFEEEFVVVGGHFIAERLDDE
ncbi:hypothetical protein GJ744_008561 [Endocarpon pusillum]|uniref:F-box domain-containing protein n=1 Tax=Endocarpon pusillum TaxID=364733 RepID=A0A8H7AKX3_9EURO|nr:hypothetical protein GJ744_008561 [Endocarpon pusillum]